jgi:hypothetical protein
MRQNAHVRPLSYGGQRPFFYDVGRRRIEHDDRRPLVLPRLARGSRFPQTIVQVLGHFEALFDVFLEIYGIEKFVQEESSMAITTPADSNISLSDDFLEILHVSYVFFYRHKNTSRETDAWPLVGANRYRIDIFIIVVALVKIRHDEPEKRGIGMHIYSIHRCV